MAEKLVMLGGVFHLGFAVFHLFFWRLFHWSKDLRSLHPINRGVMQILNLCLTFLFLVVAWISFAHSEDLVGSALGRTLLAAFALFWLLRAAEQVWFFRLRHPASAALFAIFLLGTGLYGVPLAL